MSLTRPLALALLLALAGLAAARRVQPERDALEEEDNFQAEVAASDRKAAAARGRGRGGVPDGAEEKSFCVFHGETIECPAGQFVKIYSAWYNRRKEPDCVMEGKAREPRLRCPPDATEQIGEQCDGLEACEIKTPSPLPCPENPFQRMRVVWQCVAESSRAPASLESLSKAAALEAVPAKAKTTPLPAAKDPIVLDCDNCELKPNFDRLLPDLQKRLDLYSTNCSALDNYTNMDDCGSIAIIDKTKLCSQHCQSLDVLEEALAPIDFRGTGEICHEEENVARAKRYARLLETMDRSWRECREKIAECKDLIAEAEAPPRARLAAYGGACGLLEGDLARGQDGRAQPSDRVCDGGCQAAPELAEALPAVDLAGLKARCPYEDVAAALVGLEDLRALVEALDETWWACGAGSSDTCPDRSMVGHKCGAGNASQSECGELGCCWDPPQAGRLERHACYKQRSQVEACELTCPSGDYDPAFREDCTGFQLAEKGLPVGAPEGARREACVAAGCCWQKLSFGSQQPWCFQKPCL